MNAPTQAAHRIVGLQGRALDNLMPMHLWFGPNGEINRAGPTLVTLVGDGPLIGRDVFDIVEVRKPRVLHSIAGLLTLTGQRLGLRLNSLPDLPLRGQVQALPAGTGGLINLSLGLSFKEAVERRGLTLFDFSPCDQTVELLYLHEAIRAVSEQSRRLTDRLIASERAAEVRATTDPLTGLANRRALEAALDAMIQHNAPHFALLHLDLDRFKAVNDEHGHAMGDALLVHVAEVLRMETRQIDLPARVGGDEFVVVIRECDDTSVLGGVAGRIVDRLSQKVRIENEVLQIGASIGITRSSLYETADADILLSDADKALYASKNAGRGQYTFHWQETDAQHDPK